MHILFMLLVKNLNAATFSSGNFTFFFWFSSIRKNAFHSYIIYNILRLSCSLAQNEFALMS